MSNAGSPHRKYVPFATLLALFSAAGTLNLHGQMGVPDAPAADPVQKSVTFEKMGVHMSITPLQPVQPGDRERAQAIVDAARQAVLPYQDFHKAVADGYIIQMPELDQDHYHFINPQIGATARRIFDPSRPPALIYEKLPTKPGEEPSYKLVGVMYQTGLAVSDDDLGSRIPLSIAQWHTHDDVCAPPKGSDINWLGPDKKYGFSGSLITEADCTLAGGTFMPHVGGWMTHLYPFETDPARQWRTDMDHDGHDKNSMPGMNMDMPGMKMDTSATKTEPPAAHN